MISLVMLSGGIDSTYVLHKILTETDDEVLVHHTHLITDAGRHVPEATACERIVAYCRSRYRAFHYSESTIDHRRFLGVGYDIIAAGFEAGMVASSYNLAKRGAAFVDRWFLGVSMDDTIPEHRLERARETAYFNCMLDKKPELKFFPRISLAEQIHSMPRELVDMAWSCRKPVGLPKQARPCGKCTSCNRRDSAERAATVLAAE